MRQANTYDALMANIISWGNAADDIKAVIIVGSRARTVYPADEYSDVELILITSKPDQLINSNQWLENIGDYWALFDENTVSGGIEKRVLFDNALDIDFVICPEDDIRRAITAGDVELLHRGYRVLIDKLGLTEALLQVNVYRQVCTPPTEAVYVNLVNDFWFHTVWSTKKLLRGELWKAKSCLDGYMKNLLLQMIELHAHAKNGWDYDTWFSGRFFDTWAEQRVKDGVRQAFARYDKTDMVRALLATMALFRTLAMEAADLLGFQYPAKADACASDWVGKALDI